MRPLSIVLVSLLLTSCVGDGVSFIDPDGPLPDKGDQGQLFPDQISVKDTGNKDRPTIYACDTIDILFVIDNSNTMGEEQKNLLSNFPKFINAIEAITPPIKSYHIGVISTDIGAGGTKPSGCTLIGDEGKLLHAPNGTGCAAAYPTYLTGPSATIAKDFSCIANIGVGGCGFEQQMESALVALTKQNYNKGFLRKNAPLAIIFITDEDDCSAKDLSIFDLNNATHGKASTRCVRLNSLLYHTSRYVKAFKALKDRPERLVVAAITGPPGAVKLDATVPIGMLPSCETTELGKAYPGNRFDTLIKAFGDTGVQQSLCQKDLWPALNAISKAINRACLK
jgi:hypothetical protein